MLAAARRQKRFLPYHIYIKILSTTTVAIAKKNYTPAETGLNNHYYDLKYKYRQPFRNLLKEDCVNCCFLSGMVICRGFLNEYELS
jgi:hypothetical protein